MEHPYQLTLRQYPAHEPIPYIENSKNTTITTQHFQTFDEAFFQLYFASSQRLERETAIQHNRLYFIEKASIKDREDKILLKLTTEFLDGDFTFASEGLKKIFAHNQYHEERYLVPVENTVGLDQRSIQYREALYLWSVRLREDQPFDYIRQRLVNDEETLQTFPEGFVESTIKRMPDLKSSIAALINDHVTADGKLVPTNHGETRLFSSIEYAVTEREVTKLVHVKNHGEVFDVGLYLRFTDKFTALTFINRDNVLSRYIDNMRGLFPIAYANLNNNNEVLATPQTKDFLYKVANSKRKKIIGRTKINGMKKRGPLR